MEAKKKNGFFGSGSYISKTSKKTSIFGKMVNSVKSALKGKSQKQMLEMLHRNLLGYSLIDMSSSENSKTSTQCSSLYYPPIEKTEDEEIDDNQLEESKNSQIVEYIMVIGFHHHIGGQIEFIHPEVKFSREFEKSLLFYAFPDGVHDVDSDYSYFIINEKEEGTFYGITCFRQIKSSLDIKGDEGNQERGFVQKSVLVLSKIPLFNFIVTKLNITTHVYFNQKDFKDTKILTDFYENANIHRDEELCYSDFISNNKINDIVEFLGIDLLSLIKMILLEK